MKLKFLISFFIFPYLPIHAQLVRQTLEEAGLKVGNTLPSPLFVYDTLQNRVPMETVLKGHYTVIVTGCLTCPVFYRTYPGIEALQRDYSAKGVQFYYLYKLLAHPENNGYINAFTIEERFKHIEEAKKKLQTKVPWLADPMTNEVSHTFATASNAEFLFDPDGKIVYMNLWSNADQLRGALEKSLGKVTRKTDPVSLHLPKVVGKSSVAQGIAPRIIVDADQQLIPILVKPMQDTATYFVKLRAEADDSLFFSGSGKMYIGFHLDPLHHVHWNNLAAPLKFQVSVPKNTTISPEKAEAPVIEQESDIDPREFLVEVKNWPADEPLNLTVRYFACDENDKWCIAVEQHYQVLLALDPSGGRVYDRSFR